LLNCPICDSSNILLRLVSLGEIWKNNTSLKSCMYSKLGFYFKIQKHGAKIESSSNFSPNFDLANNVHLWILERVIDHALHGISQEKENSFNSSIFGVSEIMIITDFDGSGVSTEINCFNFLGMTRAEIYKGLYQITNKLNIH